MTTSRFWLYSSRESDLSWEANVARGVERKVRIPEPAQGLMGVVSGKATRLSVKGEVRTINDRNICERRSCMKNNGKSPTFKFVSGEERRPSEVRRVSRDWRLPGATHSSADLTWIRKWLEIQAPELSELESVELELGSCCSDLDKQVSDEICRTRKRQFEIPFRL